MSFVFSPSVLAQMNQPRDHFVDSMKTCGHPDPFGAFCSYFPHMLTTEISECLSEAYNALTDGVSLTDNISHSMIAQVSVIKLTGSKVTSCCTYLSSGPTKPSDITMDTHICILHKCSVSL